MKNTARINEIHFLSNFQWFYSTKSKPRLVEDCLNCHQTMNLHKTKDCKKEETFRWFHKKVKQVRRSPLSFHHVLLIDCLPYPISHTPAGDQRNDKQFISILRSVIDFIRSCFCLLQFEYLMSMNHLSRPWLLSLFSMKLPRSASVVKTSINI